MQLLTRKYFLLIGSMAMLLAAAGGWLYAGRTKQSDIAAYVPASALGFIEIRNWPDAARQLSETKGWRQLAPSYNISGIPGVPGYFSSFLQVLSSSESAVLLRSQFAVVATGIEARGEEVRPLLALIIETRSSSSDLGKIAERRLPELARRIYGRENRETGEYGGVEIIGFSGDNPDRKLLAARIEGELILANNLDSIRACIDTRLNRTPSMAGNFYLQNARSIIGSESGIFGFVTGDGVSRLLRFAAYLASSPALSRTGVIETLQDVLTDLASKASDGIAYSSDFENGQAVERYALLGKPDLIDALKPIIRVNRAEPKLIELVPDSAREFTIINVENPTGTLDGIETAISARIGAGQSFLLHQFLSSVREVFIGAGGSQVGNEMANFNYSNRLEDRIWLINCINRVEMERRVLDYLSRQNKQPVRRENYGGTELLTSGAGAGVAAAFYGNVLAVGGRAQMMRFLDFESKQTIRRLPQFSGRWMPAGDEAAIISFSSVKDDSAAMLSTIARRAGKSFDPAAGEAAAAQLSMASSVVSLKDRGIFIESRSAFGPFPLIVSIFDGLY